MNTEYWKKCFKEKILFMNKMEEVSFPVPPDGYEYTLRKKPPIRDKDHSELTPKQLAAMKYREKNREKINEKNLNHYHQKKKENQ